jgi:hypothetical protein
MNSYSLNTDFHNNNSAEVITNFYGSFAQTTLFQYTFETFFHPFVGQLVQRLNQSPTLAGLLDPTFLSSLERDYSPFYKKVQTSLGNNTSVDVEMPAGIIDTSVGGPYAVYNWELFYHIPVMIAVHLSQNQRFTEAQKWFHLVFDPTFMDSDNVPNYPFWKFIGFRQPNLVENLVDILSYSGNDPAQLKLKQQVLAGYNLIFTSPFDPHAVARSRPLAYMYYVVMKYLDNLIAWGDSLFLQDTIETINEARLCYVLAANVLGPRPQQVPARGTTKPKSYQDLQNLGMDEMGNALVDLEVQFPFNMSQPPGQNGAGGNLSGPLFGVVQTLYFCFPPNQHLLAYWDIIADRLFKIRHCEDISGAVQQLPLFDPPLDPGMLVKAAAAGIDIGSIVSGLNQPGSPVRSQLLIQKAIEVANEVRSFGSALLSAFEKGDNEHLVALRQSNELAVQQATQNVRFLQWKQAQEATQALLRTRSTALERYTYYLRLLGQTPDSTTAPQTFDVTSPPDLTEANFDTVYQGLVGKYDLQIKLLDYPTLQLSGDSSPSSQSGDSGTGQLYLTQDEDAELNLDLPIAQSLRNELQPYIMLAAGIAQIPDLSLSFPANSPGVSLGVTGGGKLSELVRAGNEQSQMQIAYQQDGANLSARTASYQRRADEWFLQANLAARELMQIGRQVIASLIAEQVAKHEWQTVALQATQAQGVLDYLQNNDPQNPRFTSEQLYLWMQGQLTSLYYQYYRLAFDTARKAEQTMKQELMRPELDQTTFIQFNYWNAGYQGLLAGEALHLDLKRMDLAYHDNNKRELEMTRHISLRQLNPMALLQLRTSGTCTFTVPEWFFDRECPGHYMRRIKSIALSLPSVVGPFTTVNCTVTLQSSSIRQSSLLKNSKYARQGSDDDRFIDYFGSVDQIVTSTASNDGGMFETNLLDQRFLPFENSGAADSTWTLQLPQDFPPYDYATHTDAILHMRYTARPAGDPLASQAISELKFAFGAADTSALAVLFLLRNDFPSEWAAFVNSASNPPTFTFRLRKDHFPYFVQDMKLSVNSLSLYGADLSPATPQPDPSIATAASAALASNGYADITLTADSAALTQAATQVYLIIQYSAKA